jgi:acyl-CoA synthetase (AMP-forming)/AMP-acid ligase II/alkylation response protein AidB-like acyl-CoA dehydrogenase/acyl carrier protein
MMKINSSAETIVEVLRSRAVVQPQQRAYTFLVDGKVEGATFTYAELDLQARAIGALLQQHQAKGARVMLLYPQGLEVIAAFLGCLYGEAIAIPVPAPESGRLKRTLPRLQAIAKDAQATFVLTTAAILDLVRDYREQIPEFAAVKWIDTDRIPMELATEWVEPNLTPDALAYLQYTSGSTSTPKGVAISHRNLIFHSAYLQRACGYTPESVTVTWMPYFHDYGLVEGLIQPLFNGTPCFVMSPFAFIKRPINWLQAISRYGGTHSQAPNFAYDHCVRRISPAACMGMELGSWKSAGNAAEPINAIVLERFVKTFEPFGFRWNTFCPAYGLAENTLLVSSSLQIDKPVLCRLDGASLEKDRVVDATAQSKSIRTVVGCGRLVCETQVAIVDPETLVRCAPDRVGEIWVSDPSVAQGYWQRQEDTERTFHAYTADTHEGPFLRTGDLGFMKDEELFISSRIKDLVIIRGTNHYPQDIEWTVQSIHPALRAEHGAVFSVDVAGEERLVIVQEVERKQQDLDLDRVFELIRQTVAENHELDVYGVLLLKTGSILKTSSGKIQRQACRAGFLENTFDPIGTWIADKVEIVDRQAASSAATEHTTGLRMSQANYRLTGSPNMLRAGLANSIDPKIDPIHQSKQRADEVISWLRTYARDRINSQLIDERRCIPPHIVLDLGNHGVLGMQIPQQYGGLGLGNRDAMRVVEQLAAIDLTLATFVVNNDFLGIRPILRYATPAMQDELLPQLARGRELAAFALTEPTAGSNPQGIAATGVAQINGGWQLSGTKAWSGSAGWAGVINVFVKSIDAQGKPAGITGFAIRQGTAGLRPGVESLTMGMRGMVQNIVHLDRVPVGTVNLLGEPGAGMVAAQDGMLYTRLAIGAMCVGGMKRCAQLMLRYATRREIGTGRLLDNPITLARISDLTAATTAFDTLVARIADLLDRDGFVPVEAYVTCKTAGPEFLWKAADTLVQMLGGRGYVETNLASRILRDARVFRIFEGPTETLTMFLGSRVLHESTELDRFLRDSLGAATVSDRLRDATAQIDQRWSGSAAPFADSSAALRWKSMLVGEVATYAILLAALQGTIPRTSQLDRASEWVEQQFDRTLAKALSDRPIDSVLLTAQESDDLISNYTETIGDLEQTCAGEDRELDSFLRQQPSTELPGSVRSAVESEEVDSTQVPFSAVITSAPAAVTAHQTTDSIAAWLVKWIANELKTEIATINPQKSFVHYGLDSVTTIVLISDLEVWLDLSLSPALTWNYPVINELAAHLAEELNASESSAELQANEIDSNPVDISLIDLDRLSDQEVDALLKQMLVAEGTN